MLKGIFPIPFYEANNLDVTGVAASVEKQEFHRNTENNGFLSVDENLLDNPIFANLRLQVDSHVHAYKEQMKIQDTCDFYIKSSWAVVHQKGDFAQQHFHRHSVLSGVLYVLVDEKSGNIVFTDRSRRLFPDALSPEFDEYTPYNSTVHKILPKVGDIFIFPSYLSHSVEKCDSDATRLSIAFDVFVKGTLGNPVSPMRSISL